MIKRHPRFLGFDFANKLGCSLVNIFATRCLSAMDSSYPLTGSNSEDRAGVLKFVHSLKQQTQNQKTPKPQTQSPGSNRCVQRGFHSSSGLKRRNVSGCNVQGWANVRSDMSMVNPIVGQWLCSKKQHTISPKWQCLWEKTQEFRRSLHHTTSHQPRSQPRYTNLKQPSTDTPFSLWPVCKRILLPASHM